MEEREPTIATKVGRFIGKAFFLAFIIRFAWEGLLTILEWIK